MLAPEVERVKSHRRRRGFGHEDILHDDQFQILKRFTYCREFRIGLQRIFTIRVRRAHFAMRFNGAARWCSLMR